MFQAIYYEESIREHPLTKALLERYAELPQIPCERYGEIFNRKAQNFRLQKQAPSLILAQKFDNFVLKTPPGYGIGGADNFYFSHMLNCIYDCRYCFLQGMYRSANYVVFVNFEDFQQAILDKIQETEQESYFFSGYDCDSLALEPITHFVENFLPLFRSHPQAYLELRTKSTQIQFLLKNPPLPNCIVAYTLTPALIAKALEHRTPSLKRRLEALAKLQEKGWPIGLRFDPLIYCDNFEEIYREFYQEVFQVIDPKKVHSVTLGAFRLPKGMYKTMQRLYPREKLFAHSLREKGSLVTYKGDIEQQLTTLCHQEVLQWIPESKFFACGG